jgi:transposase-like protein
VARGQRSYTDADKASALALLDSNGGSVFRTAQQLGMPRKTLQEWRDGRVSGDVATFRQIKKGELSARYESLLHELLDALTPAKLKAASLRDLAWSMGVLTDKMLVLDGDASPARFPNLALTLEQQRRLERVLADRREGEKGVPEIEGEQ